MNDNNSSATPNLDYLREEVRKLKALLDEPQPGHFTWCMMYGECMKRINDFWTAKKE